LISEQREKTGSGEAVKKSEGMKCTLSFFLQFWHFCLTVRLIQRMRVAQERGQERMKQERIQILEELKVAQHTPTPKLFLFICDQSNVLSFIHYSGFVLLVFCSSYYFVCNYKSQYDDIK
jgi:hypothetical protein